MYTYLYMYTHIYVFMCILHSCMHRVAGGSQCKGTELQRRLVALHTATHCNTPQHTATHCNTLQHTAIHCYTLQGGNDDA